MSKPCPDALSQGGYCAGVCCLCPRALVSESIRSDSERLDAVESIKEARNAEADKDIEIVWGSQKSDTKRNKP